MFYSNNNDHLAGHDIEDCNSYISSPLILAQEQAAAQAEAEREQNRAQTGRGQRRRGRGRGGAAATGRTIREMFDRVGPSSNQNETRRVAHPTDAENSSTAGNKYDIKCK